MNIFEKILDDININQNVIIAIVFYIGMAYASKYGLDCLNYLCMFVFILCVISVSISLGFYTIEYSANKWYKTKRHNLEYQQCKEQCGEAKKQGDKNNNYIG